MTGFFVAVAVLLTGIQYGFTAGFALGAVLIVIDEAGRARKK